MDENALSKVIIGAAIEVHRALGPGLLENGYRQCLARELHLAGVAVAQEAPIAVSYKGVDIGLAYRMDYVGGGQGGGGAQGCRTGAKTP